MDMRRICVCMCVNMFIETMYLHFQQKIDSIPSFRGHYFSDIRTFPERSNLEFQSLDTQERLESWERAREREYDGRFLHLVLYKRVASCVACFMLCIFIYWLVGLLVKIVFFYFLIREFSICDDEQKYQEVIRDNKISDFLYLSPFYLLDNSCG